MRKATIEAELEHYRKKRQKLLDDHWVTVTRIFEELGRLVKRGETTVDKHTRVIDEEHQITIDERYQILTEDGKVFARDYKVIYAGTVQKLEELVNECVAERLSNFRWQPTGGICYAKIPKDHFEFSASTKTVFEPQPSVYQAMVRKEWIC
jgi:hypothetical protein